MCVIYYDHEQLFINTTTFQVKTVSVFLFQETFTFALLCFQNFVHLYRTGRNLKTCSFLFAA